MQRALRRDGTGGAFYGAFLERFPAADEEYLASLLEDDDSVTEEEYIEGLVFLESSDKYLVDDFSEWVMTRYSDVLESAADGMCFR